MRWGHKQKTSAKSYKDHKVLKHFNADNFKADIKCAPFHVAMVLNDKDDILKAWEQLFKGICDTHAHVKHSWTFCKYNFCNLFKTKMNHYEWMNEWENTRISQVKVTALSSEAAWTKTNKIACDKKSNASEGCISAMKHEKVVSKVFGLKKKPGSTEVTQKLNGSKMPANVSVKQLNKGLAGYYEGAP